MEKIAYELYRHLSQIAEVKLVKWGGSNKWLPWVTPWLFLKSCWLLLVKKIDMVYLQDGLLAPLGYLLKIFRKPVIITIHGLDITYKNKFYQFWVPKCVARLDKVVCISNATRQECLKRGIPEERTTIISDGISDEFYMGLKDAERNKLREEVSARLGFNLNNKKLLLSVGRLVERKGFHWFVKDVMSKIITEDKDCIYLIVGEGIYRENIQKAIEGRNLENHVLILGEVDNEMLRYLYNMADVYVMPNISVKGDMEGFGVVALEAASCGLPVVASKLEGIKDAIKDRGNGLLVEPCKVEEFASTILRLLHNDEERERFEKRTREFTLENFSLEKMTERYLEEFQKIVER
jgi:glycosyltransferase involved in cell wall biosynthesis